MSALTRLLTTQACVRCPELAASRSRVVHGCGDPASRVLFVGEAPGRHGADRTAVPFSGDRSGRALQRILVAAGLASSDAPESRRCFVTNVVRCCPPGNRTPTRVEVASCAGFLAWELDQIDPAIVVPVGRLALRAVGLHYLGCDPGAVRALHATPIRLPGRAILPMVHPARISHDQSARFVDVLRWLLAAGPA